MYNFNTVRNVDLKFIVNLMSNLPMALGSPLKKRNKGHSPGELSVVLGPILCWATEVAQPMNLIKILPEM